MPAPKLLERTAAMRTPLVALVMSIALAVGLAAGVAPAGVAWAFVAVVPGLALASLIPTAARKTIAMGLVSVCVASLAFWVIVVPWLALVGTPLTRWTLVAAGVASALVGVALATRPGPAVEPQRISLEVRDLAGLGIVVAAGLWVMSFLWSDPPVGPDWGHYWAYADQIVKTGGLESINENWMRGGAMFGDYPGFPVLLASWLLLAGLPASATAPAAGLLLILCAAGSWLVCRAWCGPLAGVVGGVVAALAPSTVSVVGWSGLANLLALAFAVPLVGVVAWLPRATGRDQVSAGIAVVGLTAAMLLTHPMIGAMFLGGLVVAGLALMVAAKSNWRSPAAIAVCLAVVAVPVLLAFQERLATLGGIQPASAYLPTRINWGEMLGSLLMPTVLIASACAGFVIALGRRSTRPLAVCSLAVVAAALAYSQIWRFGIAGEYRRSLYAVEPMAAIGVAAITTARLRLPAFAVVVAACSVVVGLAFTVRDWPAQQQDYFAVATKANWPVANKVAGLVKPGESIVTDPCWTFPAIGIARARVFGALMPDQIGPLIEAAPAAQARAVFAGGAAGRRAIAALNARWSFVDPTCGTRVAIGQRNGVPPGFVPVAVSNRLIVGYRP